MFVVLMAVGMFWTWSVVVLVAFKKSISIFQLQSPLLGQYYWFCFYFTSLAVDRAISCLFFKLSFTCLSVQQPNEMLRLVRFWGKGTVVRENQENLFQNYSTKWAGVLFGFEKVFVCVGYHSFASYNFLRVCEQMQPCSSKI